MTWKPQRNAPNFDGTSKKMGVNLPASDFCVRSLSLSKIKLQKYKVRNAHSNKKLLVQKFPSTWKLKKQSTKHYQSYFQAIHTFGLVPPSWKRKGPKLTHTIYFCHHHQSDILAKGDNPSSKRNFRDPPIVGPPFPYHSHKNTLKYGNGVGPASGKIGVLLLEVLGVGPPNTLTI